MDFSIYPEEKEFIHHFNLTSQDNPNKKINGIHLIFLELEKCKKMVNFTDNRILELWITFLINPQKLINMKKEELHQYPFLVKAIELLDETNYTPAQLVSYDRYLDSIYTWNTTMIEKFEEGREEGREEGFEKGSALTISILEKLKSGLKSEKEIAEGLSIPFSVVKRISDLI